MLKRNMKGLEGLPRERLGLLVFGLALGRGSKRCTVRVAVGCCVRGEGLHQAGNHDPLPGKEVADAESFCRTRVDTGAEGLSIHTSLHD